MKIGPIIQEMSLFPQYFEQILVHTGQHYDKQMSQIFFEELGLPKPDVNLEVGSGSHSWQTAQIMMRFEEVVKKYCPDWVIVPGDVNSTLACALVCSKLGIKVAHVEAGLRSFDRTMPEEINRLLTDQIADLLFTPSRDGDENLIREGIAREKIHLVGNIMIDSLIRLFPKAENRWEDLRKKMALGKYILVTLHRPANVDNSKTLEEIILALNDVAKENRVIFPVHPRTRHKINEINELEINRLDFIEPLGYLDFLALEAHATIVVTDSGGVQEETTFLGVPCLTVRPNTERPITITQGSNQLVGTRRDDLFQMISDKLAREYEPKPVPDFWDGKTAGRIIRVFHSIS